MHLESDVIRLFSAIPYLTLSRPSAIAFLRKVARDGAELKHMFPLYPHVLYEPLEFHYNCLRTSAALTEELIDELTTRYTWRGIVWASWAVALRPEVRFAPYLRSARTRAPGVSWIVDLSLAEVEMSECPSYAEHQALTRTIRSFIAEMPKPSVRIRQWPTGPRLVEVTAARQDVAQTYKTLGADAALSRLKSSILNTFI